MQLLLRALAGAAPGRFAWAATLGLLLVSARVVALPAVGAGRFLAVAAQLPGCRAERDGERKGDDVSPSRTERELNAE